MDIKIECPLGSQCETASDNVITRCAWYTEIAGQNPQTGKDISEWRCAMGWLPILMCEHTKEAKGTTIATESLRNAVADTGNTMMAIANERLLKSVGDNRG